MPELERFLTEKGGLGAFGALLALKLGEMIWNYFRNRDASLNKLKVALEANTVTMRAIQADLKKFKHDLRKAFVVLKRVAGDDWAAIVKEFDDFEH